MGLTEILLILGAIAIVSLFGRKTIMKLVRDGFSIKKDIEQIKKEAKVEA